MTERGDLFRGISLRLQGTGLAVKTLDDAWTYERLNEISARCAGFLRHQRYATTNPVAILMSPGPDLIAAILGVLRGGHFYTVLDASHTPDILGTIYTELGPSVLIADDPHLDLARPVSASGEIIPWKAVSAGPAHDLFPQFEENARLAVFYTSGSTGHARPIHYSMGGTERSVQNHADALELTTEDRLSLLAPCSAAASVSGLFAGLLSGACLLPFSPAEGGLHRLPEWIDSLCPTILHWIPSLHRRFLQEIRGSRTFDSVRAIKFGGEPLFSADIQPIARHFPRCTLVINGLGATEANGNICHFRLDPRTFEEHGSVPIGKPLPGYEIVLLDEYDRPAAEGEDGQMAIRNPSRQGGEWLKTGDMARKNHLGDMEHCGRRDTQFKSRGLWITPGAAEAALMTHPDVLEAACVRIETPGRESSLGGFLLARSEEVSVGGLRSFLRLLLPAHLVPKHFWYLPEFPLLPNLKVDRLRLTQEGTTRLKVGEKPWSIESTDAIELPLTRIWEAALGRDGIGLDEDFFELGGDSLEAASIFADVQRYLRVDLPIATLLTAPTIQKLARLIRNGELQPDKIRLVGLQLRGTKPPLFCVPGAGSDAISLRDLSVRLGPDYPFFGFQPQGLDGREPFLQTVEGIAARYVEILLEFQPDGPFFLCGTSFGGGVAFEMAKQLKKAGRPPLFVGLFDTRIGTYPVSRKYIAPRAWFRRWLRRFLPEDKADESVTREYLEIGLREWKQRQIVKLDLRWKFMPLPRPYDLRFVYLRESCRLARQRYRAALSSDVFHLFRTAEQPNPKFFKVDPSLGWSPFAPAMEFHELPGKHGQHIIEPNVGILAKKLARLLAKAAGSTAACSSPPPVLASSPQK